MVKAKAMNIYLDIDGTIVNREYELALGFEGFLRQATKDHNCYWLTTHCRGDAGPIVSFIEPLFSQDTREALHKVQPTTWNTWKTEAIDFSQEFRWFDDNLIGDERVVLEKHDAMKNFVRVNLKTNPDFYCNFKLYI